MVPDGETKREKSKAGFFFHIMREARTHARTQVGRYTTTYYLG